MKKTLVLLLATFALNAIPVAYAGEALPEIAAVDDATIEALADFVPAE